jgi:ribokinase
MGGQAQRLLIIGDVGVDMIMGPLSGWPRLGTETLVDQSELRPGGSAGNAALAVAYLGKSAQLVSAVGNDDLGEWLGRQLRSLGASLAVCESSTTLTVGMIDASGERTFFTTRGHLEQVSFEQLRPRLGVAPAAGSLALLSGVFLTPRLRAAYARLIAELTGAGYQVALDTNWPPQGWSGALRNEVAEWIAHCDHVLLNDLEVKSLAGEEDLEAAIARLTPLLKPAGTLVVKSGARGATAVAADGRRCECAAPRARIFDTVGAGDSFNAGYLLACLEGAGLAAAVSAGCEAAAAIISTFPRRALRAALPSREQA